MVNGYGNVLEWKSRSSAGRTASSPVFHSNAESTTIHETPASTEPANVIVLSSIPLTVQGLDDVRQPVALRLLTPAPTIVAGGPPRKAGPPLPRADAALRTEPAAHRERRRRSACGRRNRRWRAGPRPIDRSLESMMSCPGRRRIRNRKTQVGKRTRTGCRPSAERLNAAIAMVVDRMDPDQIILFGSGARAELREDSDLDLLVVSRAGNRQRYPARQRWSCERTGDDLDIVVASRQTAEPTAPERGLHPRQGPRGGPNDIHANRRGATANRFSTCPEREHHGRDKPV